ncbi:MAG: hypothetical protein DMF56_24680 [Acidobacteria bacterium]|nr:MAG: hypothetical protein DMF56_24680 [Acidobacteriota bacterium]
MKRTAIALAAFAFLIRIAAIAVTGFDRVEFGDARDYIDTAASICESGTYPSQGNLPFFRAPGLPFFIALTTACHPHNVALLKIALALVDSLTVALIALLSFSVFRSPRAAILAGIAAALYPLFLVSITDVRSEPLFMFFMTLSLYGLATRRGAMSGAALALAALTRPVALIFVPLFLIPRMRRIAFLIAFLVVLTPWTLRNYVRYGEFILVNDASGYSLWRGTHPEIARIYSIRDRDEFRRASIEFEQRFTAPMMQRINASTTSPRARSAAWRHSALANVNAHRGLEWRFALKKAWLYWRPWLNLQEYSSSIVLASAVLLIALYALGFAGIPRSMLMWVVSYFVLGWLAHIPHQVVMRFRYPLTDPLLLIAATRLIAGRFRTSALPPRDQTEPGEIPKTTPGVP